jgi:hypothetical protein
MNMGRKHQNQRRNRGFNKEKPFNRKEMNIWEK